MNPIRRKRKQQIRQRQLRRRKNVSFKQLSAEEMQAIKKQEAEHCAVTNRDLAIVEEEHGIKFKPMVEKLRTRFPKQMIAVLDEGVGRSSLKKELMRDFKRVHVTTTDIRKWKKWLGLKRVPDVRANVMDLVKAFGKNRFHMVVSTAGGAFYSPLPEKALFQIVSVLKPGGIGIVSTPIMKRRLLQLAKRFNISIQGTYSNSVVFTKNIGRSKKR